MKTNIYTTAGELAILFAHRDQSYPQWQLQAEINQILVRNNIESPEPEQYWQK